MVTVATSMGGRCRMALCTGQEVHGEGPLGTPAVHYQAKASHVVSVGLNWGLKSCSQGCPARGAASSCWDSDVLLASCRPSERLNAHLSVERSGGRGGGRIQKSKKQAPSPELERAKEGKSYNRSHNIIPVRLRTKGLEQQVKMLKAPASWNTGNGTKEMCLMVKNMR